MLRGNPPPPPTSLFFLFLSISFPSLFKKKSENFGGGGLNPRNPPPPLKYALASSNGHDGISSELLKLISDDISKCITLITNQNLMSGIFPDKLKIAKVTPIYKKK